MSTGYASYYKHQVGSGNISFYRGRISQRGHGIGGVLSSLLRGATPIFKSLGKSLLKAGVGVADDVLSGQNIRQSLVKRGRNVGKQLIKKGVRALSRPSSSQAPPKKRRRKTKHKTQKRMRVKQTGGGKRKSTTYQRKRKRKGAKRTKNDLFGHL